MKCVLVEKIDFLRSPKACQLLPPCYSSVFPELFICSSLLWTVLSLSSGSTFLIQPASKGLFFCPPLIFSQQGLRYYKQPVNLSCRPTMLTQLFSHWSTITFTDLLTAAYLVFLVIFVFGCNYLFTNFVDSKPEGRKTVLG